MTKSTNNYQDAQIIWISKPPKSSKGGCLSARVADCCLDWVIFPALLFIQFGATMYCQQMAGVPEALALDWRVVHFTIFLFCLVAGLYRQILRQHPWQSLPLLLLPEFFTNISLAFVMFSNLNTAYFVLVSLTLLLSLLGLVAGGGILIQESPVVVTSDYQLLLEGQEDEEDDWIC